MSETESTKSGRLYCKVGLQTAMMAFYALGDKVCMLQVLEKWCAEKGLHKIIWARRFGRFLNESALVSKEQDWENFFGETVRIIYRCHLRLRDWDDPVDENVLQSANELVETFIQAVKSGKA